MEIRFDLEKKKEEKKGFESIWKSEARDNPIRSDDDGPSTFRANTRSRRGGKKPRKLRVQQRHILCHWPRFDKKSLVSVAKKRFENVCAWTKEGRKGRETRRKGSRRSAAERSGGGPTRRDSLQKRARIMNILKRPQGAICWLSFQTFFQPVYIGNNVNLRGAFFILFVSCLSVLMPLSLATISSPRFFSASPFSFPRPIPSAFLPLPFASRSINARFLRWHD